MRVRSPPQEQEENRATESHEGGSKGDKDGADAISSTATPAIHDLISNETPCKASDSENGGEEGKGEV